MATKPDMLKWVPSDDPLKMAAMSTTKKNNGWLYLEKPPFQYFNYLFNQIFKWFRGLQGSYYQIVVGSAGQVSLFEATHTINQLTNSVVSAGSRVMFLEGTHVLTGDLTLSNANCVFDSENGAAVIDMANSYKFILNGDRTRARLRFQAVYIANDAFQFGGASSVAELIDIAANRVTGSSTSIIKAAGTTPFEKVGGVLSPFSTGDILQTLKTAAPTGWVMFNDGTIGNAASGATTRANADTEDLFTLIWNGTINANCAVSSGRGANAAADYAANKTIALPKTLGRALAVAGSGSGLTPRALAVITGVESVTLSQAQTPVKSHTHALTDPGHFHEGSNYQLGAGTDGNTGYIAGGSGAGTALTTSKTTGITVAAGADATASAHDNMQPSVFFNVMVKL